MRHFAVNTLVPRCLVALAALVVMRAAPLHAQQTFQPTPIPWRSGPLALSGPARPGGYLGVEGRKAAAFGTEVGGFEVWTWPLKLLNRFELAFQTPQYDQPIEGRDIARSIEVTPEGATITYVASAFTVRQRIFAAINDPAVIMVLEVEAIRPMEIIARFRADFQWAWPGGMGGQYIYWDDDHKAFVMSEPRRTASAMIGSPFATSASVHPAHALPDAPSEIRIAVGDQTPVAMPRPGEPAGRLVNVISRGIPIVIVGQTAPRDTVLATYNRVLASIPQLYQERVAHEDSLLSGTLGMGAGVDNTETRWAELNLDEAFVCNPDLGCGPVAGYGVAGPNSYRPGFGWFFGGDAAINSFALTAAGAFDLVKPWLGFFARYQRADGKITHEISQSAGRIPWFTAYPYAFYHGDTTPFWLLAIAEYFTASADTAYVRSLWPNIQKAYQWSLSTDADGDGLMDNSRAGAGAIEVGDLGVGVKSDIYLAAVWVSALGRMSALAAAVGDTATAADAARRFPVARRALEDRFWIPARHRFAFAILENDSLNDNLTVWPATAMSWHLFDEQRGQQMASELARATISTDWGGRALAAESPLFDPLHYNNGTVWPFVTGFLALAEYRYHNVYAADEQLAAVGRTFFLWGLGRNPEVFSGAAFEPLETAVPQQFFATSMYLGPMIKGALGLEADAPRGVLTFAPHLFARPGERHITGVRIGGSVLDIDVIQSDTAFTAAVRRTAGSGPLTIHFDPALAPGARVRDVKSGNASLRYQARDTGRDVHVGFDVPLDGAALNVAIRNAPGWRLELPDEPVERGERSRHLKVLDARPQGGALALTVEGLAGRAYPLLIHRPDGRVVRESLEMPRDGGDPRDGYVRLERRVGGM